MEPRPFLDLLIFKVIVSLLVNMNSFMHMAAQVVCVYIYIYKVIYIQMCIQFLNQ